MIWRVNLRRESGEVRMELPKPHANGWLGCLMNTEAINQKANDSALRRGVFAFDRPGCSMNTGESMQDQQTKTITREDMARAATSPWGCGFSLAQGGLLRELGESADTAKWVKRMVGRTVPVEWWNRFVSAGNATRAKTYGRQKVRVEDGPTYYFRSLNVQDSKRELRRDGVGEIQVHGKSTFISKEARQGLFSDPVYKVVRAAVLRASPWCKLCGRRPPMVVLNVDHIIPLTVDWSRRMDPSNLQVLCEDCNQGKSNYWS